MITFETVNELTLKVTCKGNDVLFTKAGAFIAGNSTNGKNYKFEKVLLGPQNNFAQAALGSLVRRVTGENLPLMKVTMAQTSEQKIDLIPLFVCAAFSIAEWDSAG